MVNPMPKTQPNPLKIVAARCKGGGLRWQIADTDSMAYNAPEKARQ
jgi:hypothetical protein